MRAIAAPSDPELRELWDSIETARLHGQSRFVGMLADREALRDGLSPVVSDPTARRFRATPLDFLDLVTTLSEMHG